MSPDQSKTDQTANAKRAALNPVFEDDSGTSAYRHHWTGETPLCTGTCKKNIDIYIVSSVSTLHFKTHKKQFLLHVVIRSEISNLFPAVKISQILYKFKNNPGFEIRILHVVKNRIFKHLIFTVGTKSMIK